MADIEMLKRGLRCIAGIDREDLCHGCRYGQINEECDVSIAKDVLAMLKEQEAVKPIPYHRSDGTIFKYECRKCRTKIFKMDLFCRHCGQAVKWE